MKILESKYPWWANKEVYCPACNSLLQLQFGDLRGPYVRYSKKEFTGDKNVNEIIVTCLNCKFEFSIRNL